MDGLPSFTTASFSVHQMMSGNSQSLSALSSWVTPRRSSHFDQSLTRQPYLTNKTIHIGPGLAWQDKSKSALNPTLRLRSQCLGPYLRTTAYSGHARSTRNTPKRTRQKPRDPSSILHLPFDKLDKLDLTQPPSFRPRWMEPTWPPSI